jgi:hypothetical protein
MKNAVGMAGATVDGMRSILNFDSKRSAVFSHRQGLPSCGNELRQWLI